MYGFFRFFFFAWNLEPKSIKRYVCQPNWFALKWWLMSFNLEWEANRSSKRERERQKKHNKNDLMDSCDLLNWFNAQLAFQMYASYTLTSFLPFLSFSFILEEHQKNARFQKSIDFGIINDFCDGKHWIYGWNHLLNFHPTHINGRTKFKWNANKCKVTRKCGPRKYAENIPFRITTH